MLIGIVSSFGYFGCFWPSLSWIISRIGVLCPYCFFFASAPKSVEQNNQLYINHCQTRINKIYNYLLYSTRAITRARAHANQHTHTHQSTHCELLLHAERVGAQNRSVKGTLPGHCFICFFYKFILISTGAKGTQTILQQ